MNRLGIKKIKLNSENLVKGVIYLILLSPLLASNLQWQYSFEPKTYFFRIAIDLLIIFLLIKMLIKKENFSFPLTKKAKTFLIILGLFFLSFFISSILGVNPLNSFWDEVVRSQGVLMLAHLFLFFGLLIYYFRKEEAWIGLMKFSVLAALLVSITAIVEKNFKTISTMDRISGSIHNPSFFAGYIVLSIFLAIFLVNYYWKDPIKRYTYLGCQILLTVSMILSGTRGAMLATVGGLAAYSVVYLVLRIRKQGVKILTKRKLIAALIIAISFAGIVFLSSSNFRQEKWHQYSPLKYISRINAAEGQARFFVWGIAWKGFLEKPIFGWGPENFMVVFDEYYSPEMFAFESTFDKAHNIFFETISTQGLVGILTLFILYGFIGFSFIRKDLQSNSGKILYSPFVVAFITAYFIHNMFVFDVIPNQIVLFLFLGFVFYLLNNWENKKSKTVKFTPNIPVVAIGTFVLLFSIGYLNLLPMVSSYYRVRANQELANSNFGGYFTYLEKAEKLNPRPFVSGGSATVSALNFFNAFSEKAARIEKEKMYEIASAAVDREIATYPDIANPYLEKGTLETHAARFKNDMSYVDKAMVYFDKALEISPKKQLIYYHKFDALILKKDYKGARDILAKVQKFDAANNDRTNWKLLSLALETGDQDLFKEQSREIVSKYQSESAKIKETAKDLEEMSALTSKKDWTKPLMTDYATELKEIESSDDEDVLVSLWIFYHRLENKVKADQIRAKLIAINPLNVDIFGGEVSQSEEK